MSSVLYAIFVVAILFIIHWYIQNERAGTDGNKGLLALRAAKDELGASHDEGDSTAIGSRSARNKPTTM